MGVNNSTFMNLPVPQVGNESGPQYAQDINNCLTLIDQHNHTPGNGQQITPEGLNINVDLPMAGNNLIQARSVNFVPQSAPLNGVTDIGCIYEVSNDLYYNDGVGNQVRITQSGAVAGTPGSISNLVPPASASYVALTDTFVFQSDTTTAANLDAGSLTMRNITANSFGLTLSPPNAMGSDYSLTLPSLPASTKILTLGASGTIGATLYVDNSSLTVTSNNLAVKNQGVIQSMLAPRTTGATVVAGGVAVSAPATGSAPVHDTSYDIASVTITTTGRPVFLTFISSVTGQAASFNPGSANYNIFTTFYRDAAPVSAAYQFTNGGGGMLLPPSTLMFMDFPTAGTYTYKVASTSPQDNSFFWTNVQLLAYEI